MISHNDTIKIRHIVIRKMIVKLFICSSFRDSFCLNYFKLVVLFLSMEVGKCISELYITT